MCVAKKTKFTCMGPDGSTCGRKHGKQKTAEGCIKIFKKEGEWEIFEIDADLDLSTFNPFSEDDSKSDVDLPSLNHNEATVLLSIIETAGVSTGYDFALSDEIEVQGFSKHQVAGYISSLQTKGWIMCANGDRDLADCITIDLVKDKSQKEVDAVIDFIKTKFLREKRQVKKKSKHPVKMEKVIEHYQNLENFDFKHNFLEDGVEVSFFCGSRSVKVSTDSSEIVPEEWLVWIDADYLKSLTNDWKWNSIKTGITKDAPGERKVLLEDRWVKQEDIRCIKFCGLPCIAIKVTKGLGRCQSMQARFESHMASWLAMQEGKVDESTRDWTKPLDLTPRCENCNIKMTKKHSKHHEFCDECYSEVLVNYLKSQGSWLRGRFMMEFGFEDQ